jgi:hypothetical protein
MKCKNCRHEIVFGLDNKFHHKEQDNPMKTEIGKNLKVFCTHWITGNNPHRCFCLKPEPKVKE